MQPARYNLSVWEGATYRQTVLVLQSDGATPLNLSGYTANLAVLPAPDQTPLYTMTTLNGGINLGGTAGTVNLFISAVDTASFDTWPSSAGIYSLNIIDTANTGDTKTLLWGSFKVLGL